MNAAKSGGFRLRSGIAELLPVLSAHKLRITWTWKIMIAPVLCCVLYLPKVSIAAGISTAREAGRLVLAKCGSI
jgi:hypothetical protein